MPVDDPLRILDVGMAHQQHARRHALIPSMWRENSSLCASVGTQALRHRRDHLERQVVIRLDRIAELRVTEHHRLDGPDGDHGRGRRSPVQHADLAEEVTRAEPVHGLAVARHLHVATLKNEEGFGRLSLGDQCLTRLETDLIDAARHELEFARRDPRKERHATQPIELRIGHARQHTTCISLRPHGGFSRARYHRCVFTTRPELRGTFGMVSSTHWIASLTAMAVLERGGNAFDAAVAAGFVLQVVEPHLNGPGGDVPVIAHDARRGETFVVCGQGTAPAAATVEAYTGLGLDLVPGSGLLAACVPGAFGAWLLLLREYGRLRLRDVLGYAIGYAESGYPLVPAISWSIASVADLFREHWQTSAEVYLPEGGVPAPGSRFANRALAATYQRILTEAEAASDDRDAQIA